jgi:hypothetical protein
MAFLHVLTDETNVLSACCGRCNTFVDFEACNQQTSLVAVEVHRSAADELKMIGFDEFLLKMKLFENAIITWR